MSKNAFLRHSNTHIVELSQGWPSVSWLNTEFLQKKKKKIGPSEIRTHVTRILCTLRLAPQKRQNLGWCQATPLVLSKGEIDLQPQQTAITTTTPKGTSKIFEHPCGMQLWRIVVHVKVAKKLKYVANAETCILQKTNLCSLESNTNYIYSISWNELNPN